jgi:myo-inositol-1(or 4)-monophosphatase
VRALKDLVDIAERAAERAANLVRAARPPVADRWTEKSRHDFATQVDRESEELIAETLTGMLPGSIVVGEELSPNAEYRGEIVWLVDPLDGTTNFLHGYPQYAISIGALVDGVLSVGVVHDVTRDVSYRAARGLGAWSGGQRLTISALTDPTRALVGTGFPFKELDRLDEYLRQFAAVCRTTSGIRRAGAAALDLADVAAGRFDAFWELTLAPWDIAAGIMLVREAGGVVTTVSGGDDMLRDGSVVAANPTLHQWLMDLLKNAE